MSDSRARIGVMGGTFDPIHLGHLAIAEAAREALDLGRVLFLPARIPPHKPPPTGASVDDRVAMVRLAIAGNPSFELSLIDVEREGPSYTVDSMRLVGEAARAAGRQADLTLIMSSETLAGLPDWHDPTQLLAESRIAVAPREGHPPPDRAWVADHFPGQVDRIVALDGPRLGISSTEIRERVAAGRSIRYLVPEAVERYIVDHGLYRPSVERRNPRL